VSSSPELQAYWRSVHAVGDTLDRAEDPDLLGVVCHVGMPPWYNRYFADVQQKAFRRALSHCGELAGASVLEVGCGTGRWSKLLRDLGAHVVAVDLSEEAIARNARTISGIDFRAGDFLEVELPLGGFDLAVSVTVFQHLPFEQQEQAAAKVAAALRQGGHALLLENIRDTGGHMFSHGIRDWLRLFERTGFRPRHISGFEYDLPVRGLRGFARLLRRRRLESGGPPPEIRVDRSPPDGGAAKHLTWNAAWRPTIAASRLLEPLSAALLPADWATHCALVLEREDGEGSTKEAPCAA
jgi:SAM-dependent methyltransferase